MMNLLLGCTGGVPNFEGINIHQINFNWDGPRADIFFDLSSFPETPPKKWEKFNTIQLEISIFPLLEVSVGKFSNGNICNIGFEKKGDLLLIGITGGSEVSISASCICINRVSAYLNIA